MSQNSKFSLHQIPQLNSQFHKTVRHNSNSRRAKIVFDDVYNCWKKHKCMNQSNINECRFLTQSLLGIRVANTFNIKTTAKILPKKCKKCGYNKTCTIIKIDCFNRLVFHTGTKTNAEYNMPILPQILSCIESLQISDQSKYNHMTKELRVFNEFMKLQYNTTSHANRAILPNLLSNSKDYNNTGAWESFYTMKKHYLQKDAKYMLACSLLV